MCHIPCRFTYSYSRLAERCPLTHNEQIKTAINVIPYPIKHLLPLRVIGPGDSFTLVRRNIG
jgi:hypothetical protein